jgi:hypothetical protein
LIESSPSVGAGCATTVPLPLKLQNFLMLTPRRGQFKADLLGFVAKTVGAGANDAGILGQMGCGSRPIRALGLYEPGNGRGRRSSPTAT